MQEENNKPATKTSDIKIPDQLKGLFCEPTLLEGEDPRLFWDLVAAVIAERKPETASDWIAVSDLVTNLWEERLLRRGSSALIRGGMIGALQNVLLDLEESQAEVQTFSLKPLVEEQPSPEQRRAERKARAYYRENPKQRRELGAFLTECGMTEAELYATAFERNGEALQMFERMIAARERRRRKLRKEDERRRREQMKGPSPNGSASRWPVKNSSGPTAKTPSGVQGRKPQPDV